MFLRFALFRNTRMASRVRSDTLRAPVTEHWRCRAEYSSSESRTLIMRERGVKTFISSFRREQREGIVGYKDEPVGQTVEIG